MPRPTRQATGATVEQLWQLFVDSGYFNLAGRSASWFEDRRTRFMALGRRAAELPQVLHTVVWPSERGVEATLSTMKAYRSLWLVHQLAKRQGGARYEHVPGQMLWDVYARTVEHALADADCRWLAAYIESTVPFVHRAHASFIERRTDASRVLLLPLRMIDVDCQQPLPASSSTPQDVGPATREERSLLAEAIAGTRPSSYVDALDLSAATLDFEGAARPWRAAGLERERHVLVARHAGAARAAAVLELGPPGTNPFHLLDAARLFPLSPGGRDAFPALLAEARRWYAPRGRDSFVFMAEADGDVEAAGLRDTAPEARPALWLIPADLGLEFLQHIHEQTVRRPLLHRHPEKEPS